MITKHLDYAIGDAKRFVERAKESIDEAYASEYDPPELSEAAVKMIRRLSLDVTHAMKELRAALPVTAAADEEAKS